MGTEIIYGDSYDIDKLKGTKVLEFQVDETVYKSGRTEVIKWSAIIMKDNEWVLIRP